MTAQIRDYRAGDAAAIRSLFQTVFGETMTEAQWHWKYRNALERNALPVVATTDDGELVGHGGVVYLDGWHQGRQIPFLQICDIMVAPKARGHLGSRNLYTQIIRQLFDQLYDRFPNAFTYGFPGARPFKLGKYVGAYERIELAEETELLTMRPAPWITIKAVPLVSADLDRLWGQLRRQFALCLIRDSSYVTWRYAEHPSAHYERVNFYIWGRLAGWSIVRKHTTQTQIIDIFCLRKRLPSLLAALSQWLKEENASPAVVWLPEAFRTKVKGESRPTEVRITNGVRGFDIATCDARRDLYYTMGDLDIF